MAALDNSFDVADFFARLKPLTDKYLFTFDDAYELHWKLEQQVFGLPRAEQHAAAIRLIDECQRGYP